MINISAMKKSYTWNVILRPNYIFSDQAAAIIVWAIYHELTAAGRNIVDIFYLDWNRQQFMC